MVLGSQERATYSIDLIQDLPLFIGCIEGFSRLDGSLHLTGPNLQVTDVLLLDELAQLLSKLQRKCVFFLFFFTVAQEVRRKKRFFLDYKVSYLLPSSCEA